MDPRDFQSVATKLAFGRTKAEFRSSISRAYYAAHHVGAEFLTEIGTRLSTGAEAHSQVVRYLSNSKDKELIKIGSQLSDLISDRIKADYRMDNTDIETQDKAKLAVSQASKMISVLEACSKNSDRKKAASESIKIYLEKMKPASK